MTSLRIACCAFAASALFLSGALAHRLLSPAAVLTSAQAATVNGQGNVQTATARIQNGEDGLIVLSGDTLLAYRTNVASKTMELIAVRKLGAGDEPPAGGAPRHK